MRRAMDLAMNGEGYVEPNPMVGAVIVRNHQVIGSGWHGRFGGPHAEVEAIKEARALAGPDATKGATLYVTLEPCCHWGKTPPCTDALIEAGISRVAAAIEDPNPKVAGGGIHALRTAGIQVDIGMLEDAARQLNAPFLKRLATRRPWVILKWAQSLDGKIATRTGDSKWISSEASLRRAHALRGRVDAIVVGIGTVLADDPELTCRMETPKRVAARVVLDSALRIPPSCKLVQTAKAVPTVIFTTDAGPAAVRAALEAAGCAVVVLASSPAGVSLEALLDELGRRELINVMVEGGGRVLGSFFDAGLADEAMLFVAPKLIGGAAAPGPLWQDGVGSMDKLAKLKVIERATCGPDQLWRIRF